MRLLPRSIRWRVQLWYALLLAVIVGSLLLAFHRNQREIRYQSVDRSLTDPITRLLPRLERGGGPPPGGRRPPGRGPGRGGDFGGEFGGEEVEFGGPGQRRGDREGELDEVVAELADRNIYLIHWDRRGEVRFGSENVPEGRDPQTVERPSGGDEMRMRTLDRYREVIHTAPSGGILLLGTSIEPLEKELSALAFRLAGAGVVIVGGGFVVGWLLIGRSLRPIRWIGAAAHRIADGDLSDRIKIGDRESELGRLSGVLNDTFEKLERSFEHQVRFTADASHEMRTPIAVIMAKSQFALSRERSPEKYQECLQTCLESAQHMRSLTDALLELSKADSGELMIRAESGNPGELVREVVAMMQPVADEKSIMIRCDLDDTKAVYDPQKIKQALLNLVSNAVKYNREGGEVEVILKERDDEVVLKIHDTGPGIDGESLKHLFERFYRVDRARKRQGKGGTGLGLAITKAIVEAHGGSITVTSELGKGSVFEVRLPRVVGR